MSVNLDNDTPKGNAPGADAGATRAEAGYQQRSPQRRRMGMSSLGERLPRSMKRNQMGEVLTEYQRAVDAIFSGMMDQNGAEFKVLPLDADRYDLHYSAVILVAIMNVGGQKVASTYTMLLEGSASDPRPVILQVYGQPVESIRTAMDAWDEGTWQKVEQVVSQQYGDGINITNAGAMVIPAEVESKDEERVWQIVWSAQEAVLSNLESTFPDDFAHFNLAEMFDPSRDRMNASFTYNGDDGEAVTGLPIRSDITLVMSSSERNSNNRDDISSFQHQTSRDLMEVNSYVDLVYAPNNQVPAPGQQPPTQIFMPRVVLTKITALDAPYTPETFLLGVATSCLLGENYNWASQFANFSQEEVHDVGGVGYRMKNPSDPQAPGAAIDTKTNTFGQNELFDLVQHTCWKDPAFSIDCEDVGPESWLTGALIDAAHNNAQAMNYIVQAANNLTNGHFSQIWQGGAIVASENNKVHLGTYVDAQGQIKDLREIDSLAVLNHFGHNDITAVNLWESTFNDAAAPIELRLEKRMQMIRQLAGKLKVRGFAERLTFVPDFLDALVQASVRAGLMVDQDGLQSLYGQNVQVGNSFLQNYAAHTGASGMMNQGGPQGNHAFRRPMSRWG